MTSLSGLEIFFIVVGVLVCITSLLVFLDYRCRLGWIFHGRRRRTTEEDEGGKSSNKSIQSKINL